MPVISFFICQLMKKGIQCIVHISVCIHNSVKSIELLTPVHLQYTKLLFFNGEFLLQYMMTVNRADVSSLMALLGTRKTDFYGKDFQRM